MRPEGFAAAVDAVMTGEANSAFVPVRPPGHHATGEKPMGFCLFNNIAVGARYAQNNYKEIERVAMIDWDVHHGNGTQGIFYDDPTVFFLLDAPIPLVSRHGSEGRDGIRARPRLHDQCADKGQYAGCEPKAVFEAAMLRISPQIQTRSDNDIGRVLTGI